MKCRVCGAELKKDGEDKTPVYGFKSTFILGYEL